MRHASKIVRSLAALAHPFRLTIFRLLGVHEPPELPAGEIAVKIGASATNTSFHLKEMERAGLLTARRDGRHIHHSLAEDGVRELLSYLQRECVAPEWPVPAKRVTSQRRAKSHC